MRKIQTCEMRNKELNLPFDEPLRMQEVLDSLNKKQFSLKDIGVSARVHNSWRSAGIIPNAEPDGKWVSYNFYQYLWLRIVNDLREFGLPIEAILHWKEILFADLPETPQGINEKTESFMANFLEQRHGIKVEGPIYTQENYNEGKSLAQSPFNGLVYNYLYLRSNTSFYFYLDGFVDVWSDVHEQTNPDLKPPTDEPHIVIPLGHYILEFLTDENKAEYLKTLPILTYEEKEVLQAMRNQQLKELTVKFIQDGKSRKIDIITKADGELTEEQTKQIMRILSLGNYQNISLKKHNGSKLYFEHEKRQKL